MCRPTNASRRAGGAHIGFYVCATVDLVGRKGAYMKSNVCAARAAADARRYSCAV
jgi:hypothetical protein